MSDDDVREEEQAAHQRDENSSLQPQYEDSLLPDREWEREGDS